MNYVDVKITVWNRLLFDKDADMNKVLSIIQQFGISETIYETFGVVECKTLYETETLFAPLENAGQATIEIYEDDKLKWDNSMNTNDTIGA